MYDLFMSCFTFFWIHLEISLIKITLQSLECMCKHLVENQLCGRNAFVLDESASIQKLPL